MITLYTFGPSWGLPDPSPFVMKAEMLLKLAGVPYQTDTRGFGKAPKGKLPYLRDGETVVADSTLIRLYLEKQYSIDFDRGYGSRERGIGWSVDKMLEDHLYWVVVYWRWLQPDNFERGPKAFFNRAPAFVRPLAQKFVLGRLRKTLQAIDEVMPGRRLAVCRELTKLHEEVFLGTAAESLAHFQAPRGEIVLVIEGSDTTAAGQQDERELADEVAAMKRLGLNRAQATALLARRGVSRRRAYELWLRPEA